MVRFVVDFARSRKWLFGAAWQFRLGFELRTVCLLLARLHCTLRARAPGAIAPHCARVLAFQACPSKPLLHGANVAQNCPHNTKSVEIQKKNPLAKTKKDAHDKKQNQDSGASVKFIMVQPFKTFAALSAAC